VIRLTQGKGVLVISDESGPVTALEEALWGFEPYQFSRETPESCPGDLAGLDAVVMLARGELEPRVERALIRYATDGGRLVVLHRGAVSSERRSPEWLRFLGIEIGEPRGPNPWRVVEHTAYTIVNLRPGHTITTKGIRYPITTAYRSSDSPSAEIELPAFELADTEVLANQVFTDGRTKTVLLGSKFRDPTTGATVMQDRAGWAKTVGTGTLVYLQPGSGSDFANEVYSRIVHNAIGWDSVETMLPPLRIPSGTRRRLYAEDPHAWVDLEFDPKLSGWVEYGWPPGSAAVDAGGSAGWTWDPEAAVLRTPGVPHTHLLSRDAFADFILHVEWRYLPGEGTLNSGVFVRMVPNARVMHQIECLMGRVGIVMGGRLDEGVLYPISASVPDGHGGWRRVENHTSNAWSPEIMRVADMHAPAVPQAFVPSEEVIVHPPGEWNTYELLCAGRRITVWTNGVVSSHTDSCTVRSGAIGFEAEGHAVEFRNLRVKVIAPA
jgi:hypothetical protein